MYVNVDRMEVRVNGEMLDEVDWFKYLVPQLVVDGCERDEVHRMNEGYKEWGALKILLSNSELV